MRSQSARLRTPMVVALLAVPLLVGPSVHATSGGYFSAGYLSGRPGFVVGGGNFGSVGPLVLGGEGFGFGIPQQPGSGGSFYAAYALRPHDSLLVLLGVSVGGGGSGERGGWFAGLGIRAFYLPKPQGFGWGLGVDYLTGLAGEPPSGFLVRLLVGGGSR